MNIKRSVAQLLQHLQAAGVTHLPKVELPVRPRSATKPRTVTARAGTSAAGIPTPSVPEIRGSSEVAEPGVLPAIPRPVRQIATPKDAGAGAFVTPHNLPEVEELTSRTLETSDQKSEALKCLSATVAKCTRCQELAATRTQTVFGVGNPNAKIMLIGEAPGADEDAQGEPFVGRAGQLLNKIMEASQLKREDVYICNILRCRPPGNRNPQPQEAANCREYLDAQIRIVSPQYIICLGTVAAQNLLNETRAVGKLRGQFFEHNGARVMCTYHPSYLLRNPSAKKQVWDDMKFFMKDLGVELQ
jgi:uracil-DNA glycosylase family 4